MPVVKTDKTFRQLRNEAEDRFIDTLKGTSHPAVALVYHGGGAVDFIGIRIECLGAKKEFVSKVPFGRDPEGTLYYQNVSKLTGVGVYEIRFKVGEVLEIKVFTPNKEHVATFVGKDPASAIGWLQFDADHPDVPLRGNWLDYDGFNVPGTITCQKGSYDATISLTSFGKKVTFRLPSPCVNGINHGGTMTVSSNTAVANGTRSFVDFDADRVLFYPQQGSTVMTAYFIPEIAQGSDLVALGGQKFITYSAEATWSSL